MFVCSSPLFTWAFNSRELELLTRLTLFRLHLDGSHVEQLRQVLGWNSKLHHGGRLGMWRVGALVLCTPS